MTISLIDELASFACGSSTGRRPADSATDPAGESRARVAAAQNGRHRMPAVPDGEPVVLADRADGTVIRIGSTVSKAHAPDSDPADLAARLRAAAHPRLAGILLPPLKAPAEGELPTVLSDGRAASLWPYGDPVCADDPEAAPWEEAATLLARLHAVRLSELPGPLPFMRGPAKAARAVDRLCDSLAPAGAVAAVKRAWAGLPAWARNSGKQPRDDVLCHGDLHLGQFVRHPVGDGCWLLIDVDDLGIGEPVWDLARPASWYATGLLAPEVWARFLGAYRAAGGRAMPPQGDPWPELDVPARALTVQSAALALVKATAERRVPDEAEEALVDACARMGGLPPLPPGPARRAS